MIVFGVARSELFSIILVVSNLLSLPFGITRIQLQGMRSGIGERRVDLPIHHEVVRRGRVDKQESIRRRMSV